MRVVMPVYGTRPEAIKMAPIIAELRVSDFYRCVVTVTGQHRTMLDQVNEIFGIEPDYDLNIIEPGQTLASIMSRTISGLDRIFSADPPSIVLVQGDTTTSTAAAIAAFYRQIPVVHIEAGLRSGDLTSPFPEEGNRKITSQIATLHMAPTETNKANLVAEGVTEEAISVTGNTVIDALGIAASRRTPFSDARLKAAVNSGRRIILLTTHRRENQGGAMHAIGRAIARIANSEPDVLIVFPVHRNPIVRDNVLPPLLGLKNVLILEPLEYGEFAHLLSLVYLVLTDSGGVQEEAPSLSKPVLVMRNRTERQEAIEAGTAVLVGTCEDRIHAEALSLLHDESRYMRMSATANPYGDGQAARRIVAALNNLPGH